MAVSVSAVHPRDCAADWELRPLPLPSITREDLLHIASLENDQNSKFEVWFLLNL